MATSRDTPMGGDHGGQAARGTLAHLLVLGGSGFNTPAQAVGEETLAVRRNLRNLFYT